MMSKSKNVVPSGWSNWFEFPSDSIYEHIYLGNTEKVKEMLPNVVKNGKINEIHEKYCGFNSDYNWNFTALGVSIAFGKKDIFEILMKQSGIDFTSNNSGGLKVCVLFTNYILHSFLFLGCMLTDYSFYSYYFYIFSWYVDRLFILFLLFLYF